MEKSKHPHHIRALGIMSGTSLDAIDCALITTDGISVSDFGAWDMFVIAEELRERLFGLMQGRGDALLIEQDYTRAVGQAVQQFLARHQIDVRTLDVIGFHGQTIMHRPHEGITWQLGNPSLLAEMVGCAVVADFRRRDMAAGGQGAPLVPLYHAALAHHHPKPCAFINIGGIANITYMHEDVIYAWDVGMGNALINDWMMQHTDYAYDHEGACAAQGTVDEQRIAAILAHPFFAAPPPKSLDRYSFTADFVQDMSLHDGAATLSAFTAEGVARTLQWMPQRPKAWWIGGGGRLNHCVMQMIAERTQIPAYPVEHYGWRGDALEAEAFAFLAARSFFGLPISLPTTTGVAHPCVGGGLYR
ncbi:MAG: anhydro-N-acetylmuramic acid kinase [Alphaproteobacteria bacterium]|nr:MAG: anhydro-N-acetylmuramic acid kinase [Alphaproteobacteria bacterium]TAF13402.1 MAG: anhydro-N-acetylmuramic acid kinase [Alphaproteobacteria bacterium]TAF41875.1 MAG: anhydro-N-acetylmuramic acid kinase [Alphaproteobacteria bacterium]TAF77218.1 MAG: anhydro-N-acetylmuramic acid kinase [Alphaproteobacteria bacterium]